MYSLKHQEANSPNCGNSETVRIYATGKDRTVKISIFLNLLIVGIYLYNLTQTKLTVEIVKLSTRQDKTGQIVIFLELKMVRKYLYNLTH